MNKDAMLETDFQGSTWDVLRMAIRMLCVEWMLAAGQLALAAITLLHPAWVSFPDSGWRFVGSAGFGLSSLYWFVAAGRATLQWWKNIQYMYGLRRGKTHPALPEDISALKRTAQEYFVLAYGNDGSSVWSSLLRDLASFLALSLMGLLGVYLVLHFFFRNIPFGVHGVLLYAAFPAVLLMGGAAFEDHERKWYQVRHYPYLALKEGELLKESLLSVFCAGHGGLMEFLKVARQCGDGISRPYSLYSVGPGLAILSLLPLFGWASELLNLGAQDNPLSLALIGAVLIFATLALFAVRAHRYVWWTTEPIPACAYFPLRKMCSDISEVLELAR